MASTYTPTIGDAEELTALVEANKPTGSQLGALPKRLSPSRAADFKKCPQAFYFKTICKIREPASAATLRGTLTHAGCERIFDHPPHERTADLAVSYLRPAWEELINPDTSGMSERDAERALEDARAAVECVAPGSEDEQQLLADAEACVRAWFLMERVTNFTPRDLTLPNGDIIDGREVYVHATLKGLTVHGYVDRLDRYETPDGQVRWSISDYKTSAQVPWLKNPNYPKHVQDRIRDDAFFQLRLYALAAWHLFGIRVGMLRLVYVATGDRENGIGVEYVDQALMDRTEAELQKIWAGIKNAARTGQWNTNTGPLCNWCYFKDICPAWSSDVSDIVAEDPANQ